MTSKVYLSIGSNIDREQNVRSAITCLKREFGDLEISPIYESEPVGFEGDAFLNLIVGIDTNLTISQLNAVLKAIEDQHGRERFGPKFSSRRLDIDVVTYGDFVGELQGVELPRPELFYNAFVLLPMIDLLQDALEPKTGQSYYTLLEQLPANQCLSRIELDVTSESLSI